MATAPSPKDIYERAKQEGQRRLTMTSVEKLSTGFIAGVTIIFGIVALAVTHSLALGLGAGPAELLGALAFSIGLVFVVVGRTELFSENFFGPVAAALSGDRARSARALGRLWALTLISNLIGGAVLAGLLTVEGALPDGAPDALTAIAEEIAGRGALATIVRAVAAGALLTLLSYMLHACDSIRSRISVTLMVGFFVAVGPFDHVVVSALHLLFGVWFGDAVSYVDLTENVGLATAGNLAGGLLLITLTHTAQVKASRS